MPFLSMFLGIVGSTIVCYAGTPPSGYSDTRVVGGLQEATDLAFAPDGRIFLCAKGGKLRVFKNGKLLSKPFLSLAVNTDSEKGLLGVAFDPDFETNQYVYVFYTRAQNNSNRVSRFTAKGDVGIKSSELVLIDNLDTDDCGNHDGGGLRFGPDGKLYVSYGDGGCDSGNAQDRTVGNMNGKILRINTDGSIPADNPYIGSDSLEERIWFWGLRNPWRFSWRPLTGRMYIGDVGSSVYEEVDVGAAKGSNFGWPVCEGKCNQSGMKNPIYTYAHGDDGASITGGVFWRNDYFFGDYVKGFIRRMVVSSTDKPTKVTTFEADAGAVVSFAAGPDGALYYVVFGYPGELRKIDKLQTLARGVYARRILMSGGD